MEDVELAKRLRRIAGPLLFDSPETISAQGRQENGALRQTVRNWTIQAAIRLGIPAERLVRSYRAKSAGTHPISCIEIAQLVRSFEQSAHGH